MTCSAADAFSSSCSAFLRFAHLPSPRRARPTRARAECSGTFGRKAPFPVMRFDLLPRVRSPRRQADRAVQQKDSGAPPERARAAGALSLRRCVLLAADRTWSLRRSYDSPARCVRGTCTKQAGPAALSNGGPLYHSAERTESFDSRSRSLQPPIQRRLRTRPPPQRRPSQIPPRRRRRARRSGRS